MQPSGIDAKIDCGKLINSQVIHMHYLDLVVKATQVKSILAILWLEKHWTEVETSPIAYSLSVSACFQICDCTLFTENRKLQSAHSASKLTHLDLCTKIMNFRLE